LLFQVTNYSASWSSVQIPVMNFPIKKILRYMLYTCFVSTLQEKAAWWQATVYQLSSSSQSFGTMFGSRIAIYYTRKNNYFIYYVNQVTSSFNFQF